MAETTDDIETFTILLTEDNGTAEDGEFPWLVLPALSAGALGAGALGTELYYILTRM